MKQSEERKTRHVPESEKRGRGRPRRIDTLTDAQRAQRYRDKRKSRPATIKRDDIAVTKNTSSTLPTYGMLEARIILLNSDNLRLADDLQEAFDHIAALKTALANAEHALSVTRHGKSPGKKAVRR